MSPLKTPQNKEIAYLEADINYTIFHLHDGKKMVSSFTLKRYEEDTRMAGFLRVHKSFLLNPAFVKSVEKEGKIATVTMQDGTALKVSRRKIFLITGLYPKY